MTARHNRSDIERGLRDGRAVASRIRVEYVGMPTSLFRWWDRFGRPGKQLHYLLCQQAITRITSRLHQAVPFDVAHHVTIAADFMPCGVSRIDGLPLVWGPVGGAQHIPASCRRWLGWRGRSLELARRLLADPLRHVAALRTARRAALVVSQNDDAARYWSKRGIRAVTRPNVFLDDPQLETDSPLPWNAASERRHAVFVGRLVAWKGVHLALATMAEPAAAGWELHFFGTGPEEGRLRERIRELGLDDSGPTARSTARGRKSAPCSPMRTQCSSPACATRLPGLSVRPSGPAVPWSASARRAPPNLSSVAGA